MEEILDVTAIIKRAKDVLGFKNDSELADYLGVSRATVSNWGARNSIDYRLLLTKLKDVDYNWLLWGKGLPGVSAGHYINAGKPQQEQTVGRYVTLYNITAATDLKSLLADKQQYVMGEMLIPNIAVCDGAIYVNGDSMYPILKAGDIIGYKEIKNFDNVIYGEMYLISFMIDGDEYLTVKYVNRSEKRDCIKLVSYNTHHEPMDIPLSSINAMALVKFSVRKHTMM